MGRLTKGENRKDISYKGKFCNKRKVWGKVELYFFSFGVV